MFIPTILSVALAGITEEGLLENTARPTHQHITLEIDPFRSAYEGHTTITLEVEEPMDTLTLHADGLFIEKAKLNGKAAVFPEPNGAVTLEFKKTVDMGTAVLEIDFSSKYVKRDEKGKRRPTPTMRRFSPWEFGFLKAKQDEQIARDKEAKRLSRMGKTLTGKTVEEIEAEREADKKLFKQMEKDPDTESQVAVTLRPAAARLAFPSFDEPQIRSTFELEIVTPSEYTALSNTPLEGTAPGKKGAVRHMFAATPEMPAQMLGFAVGKMESVEIAGGDVPGKLYFKADVDEAYKKELLSHFGEPMKMMGAWFGTEPFAKRDVFLMASGRPGGTSVQTTSGLAIYPANTLGKPPSAYLRPAANAWFGGVVSPKTWGDVWVMDALATLVEHQVAVEGPHGMGSVSDLVENLSSQAGGPKLVQADVAAGSVKTGASPGAYKATLILQMLDAHAPGKVKEGVLAWLAEGGASDLDGLLGHLATATGVEADVLKGWFENPGLPLVTLTRTDDGFEVTSAPFAAWPPAPEPPAEEVADDDEEAEEESPITWALPFAARTASGDVRALVPADGGKVEAAGWMMPTQPAFPFVFADPADLDALVDAHADLNPAEHLYLLGNLRALVAANAITPDRAVRAARKLGKTAPPEAVVHIIHLVEGLRLVSVEDRKAVFASLRPVIDTLGAKLDASHPDYPMVQFVRFELGDEGGAKALEDYAKQAMDDPDALTSGQLQYGMLHHGLGKGNEALDKAFERIDDEFEEHPEVYYPLIEGVGRADAYTRKKVGAWLMKEPASDERFEVFERLFRSNPDETLAWMEKNKKALLRIPDKKRASVLDIALEGVCEVARVDAVAEVAKRYDSEDALDLLASKRIEAEACQTWQGESREAFLASLEAAD